MRPVFLLALLGAALAPAGATAQLYPPGFDCSRLTNDDSRSSCYGQQPGAQTGAAPAFSFPPGFDCGRLTNEAARQTCLRQQPGGKIPKTALEVPKPPLIPEMPELSSTGTGFYVTSQGHLLTNAHVVDGCSMIHARRHTGETFRVKVLRSDPQRDLALLEGPASRFFSYFRNHQAPLGEGVTLFGFPLAGTLAVSGNLTTGTISALAGLGDDNTLYQISAPVHPGNSGGAVLDESGLVIGVVRSKLNAARFQKATGDIPQNVNFAIKGDVARVFLAENEVMVTVRPAGATRRTSDLASDAMKFTVLLACFK